jgi:hypothetical protein
LENRFQKQKMDKFQPSETSIERKTLKMVDRT